MFKRLERKMFNSDSLIISEPFFGKGSRKKTSAARAAKKGKIGTIDPNVGGWGRIS